MPHAHVTDQSLVHPVIFFYSYLFFLALCSRITKKHKTSVCWLQRDDVPLRGMIGGSVPTMLAGIIASQIVQYRAPKHKLGMG
uniref:Uncharacterized protein n=1 Tax=Anopheles darlingi TaxID=43151 RepID=A0A2M4DRN7_ANODA